MFASFIRAIFFIGIVGVATWLAYHLMEDTGSVRIDVAGFEYALTPLAAVFCLLLAFLVLAVLLKALQMLYGVKRIIDRAYERRGWETLTKAMIALTEGDARAAKVGSAKASRLLNHSPLAQLALARAVELAGNREEAKACYTALAEEKRTAFIGVKGLIELALSDGDEDEAHKLTLQARHLRPWNPWVLNTLYTLQHQKSDWVGARNTLAAQRRAGVLPKPELNRRDAMLALAQAKETEEQLGNADQARKLALEAVKLDPENMDAVSVAVRHLVAAGRDRAANRLVLHAWRIRPCAQLASAYAAIKPDETPAKRAERFEALLNIDGAVAESNLIRAELALIVQDWAGARRAMSLTEEKETSARRCAIMAAIARGEGKPDAVVRGWLARALVAPRNDAEGGVLDYEAMLPLLVGGVEEMPGETQEAVVPQEFEGRQVSEEPQMAEEPKMAEEPQVAEEPKAAEEPKVAEEPFELEEPHVAEDPQVVDDPQVADDPRMAEVSRMADDPQVAEESRVVEDPLWAEEPHLPAEAEKSEEIEEAEKRTDQSSV